MRLFKALRPLWGACVMGLLACAAQPFIDRGDLLLAAGDAAGALSLYGQGQAVEPANASIAGRQAHAWRVLWERTWARAFVEAGEGHIAAALSLARRADDAVKQSPENHLTGENSPHLHELAQTAEMHVTTLQTQGRHVEAVAISQQVLHEFPDSTHQAWAKWVRTEGITALRAAAGRLVTEHPGSAALQWALAYDLGDPPTDRTRSLLRNAWQRFSERTCLAAPQLTIRLEPHVQGEDFKALLLHESATRRQSWGNPCEHGGRPLPVQLVLEGVNSIDQVATAPAAIPRRGVQRVCEEPAAEQEIDSNTEEQSWVESRGQDHGLCAPGDAACKVHTHPVPVKRLHVVDHVHTVEHFRMLPNLPDEQVYRYQRTTVTRRVTCKGRISVQGANFASMPFAVTVESRDEGHDPVGDVLAADPLKVQSLAQLTQQAAERATTAVFQAAEEAAQDLAQERGELAEQLAEAQPEKAEELYLSMLSLGVDQGAPMHRFFSARYGKTGNEVLASLKAALGVQAP